MKPKNKLGSIEDKEWLFASMKWEGSAVLMAMRILANLLTCLSLLTWVRRYLACHKRFYPSWAAETWVALLLLIVIVGLMMTGRGKVAWWVIASAVYVLIDSVGSVIRDVVISPTHYKDKNGPYISVYDGTRWLVLGIFNVVEVILCFAILFLFYGQQFIPAIEDATTAIYFSSVTFISLGYGDIRPIGTSAKMLVCFEIFTFLLFLVIRVPTAVSILRIKEERAGPHIDQRKCSEIKAGKNKESGADADDKENSKELPN